MKELSYWEQARRKFKKTDEKGMAFLGSILGLLAGILLSILALRFVFRLLGANPNNGFVEWVYATSRPFVEPFFGIFNQDVLNVTTGAFEIATLVALIVYGLIASLVVGLTSWPHRRSTV